MCVTSTSTVPCCSLVTTVVDDTLLYNITAFNGFTVNKEHAVIPVLI